MALLAGCKKDAQVDSVLTELDTFTKEMVAQIDSAPNPSAGVDAAQKFLDSRKADLQAKLGTLKGLRGYQVSDETKKKMMESMTQNVMSVGKLKIKYMTNAMRDPALNAKLDKLNTDYQSLLKSMGE
ncbi:MAG: hypothetical protein H0T60_18050 [Acidobacteria bacterium]|nr:hypothetical protein [Acidobacteriota bacterium]